MAAGNPPGAGVLPVLFTLTGSADEVEPVLVLGRNRKTKVYEDFGGKIDDHCAQRSASEVQQALSCATAELREETLNLLHLLDRNALPNLTLFQHTNPRWPYTFCVAPLAMPFASRVHMLETVFADFHSNRARVVKNPITPYAWREMDDIAFFPIRTIHDQRRLEGRGRDNTLLNSDGQRVSVLGRSMNGIVSAFVVEDNIRRWTRTEMSRSVQHASRKTFLTDTVAYIPTTRAMAWKSKFRLAPVVSRTGGGGQKTGGSGYNLTVGSSDDVSTVSGHRECHATLDEIATLARRLLPAAPPRWYAHPPQHWEDPDMVDARARWQTYETGHRQRKGATG
jgi:hypothetical protein